MEIEDGMKVALRGRRSHQCVGGRVRDPMLCRLGDTRRCVGGGEGF